MSKPCPKCGGELTGTGRWCRACKNEAVKAYRATPEGAAAYRRYRESPAGRAAILRIAHKALMRRAAKLREKEKQDRIKARWILGRGRPKFADYNTMQDWQRAECDYQWAKMLMEEL